VGSKRKSLVKEQLGAGRKFVHVSFFEKFFRASEIRGEGDIQIQDSEETRVCMGGHMPPIISDVLMTLF
jgi:hypothetical protein